MPEVKIRRFMAELKHRPPDDPIGDREQLIAEIQIEVPRLANSDWEKGINQAFIFSAGYSDIIMRLEINPFQDEIESTIAG